MHRIPLRRRSTDHHRRQRICEHSANWRSSTSRLRIVCEAANLTTRIERRFNPKQLPKSRVHLSLSCFPLLPDAACRVQHSCCFCLCNTKTFACLKDVRRMGMTQSCHLASAKQSPICYTLNECIISDMCRRIWSTPWIELRLVWR